MLGSKSDKAVAEKATGILRIFEINYSVFVASAHRSPDRVVKLMEESGASVFIGIAGLSAALPGVMAAHTVKPVIGVPVSGTMNLDAALSVLQMPPYIPVAGVGLDRGENAALLAVSILALQDEKLTKNLRFYREELARKVEADSKEIEGL